MAEAGTQTAVMDTRPSSAEAAAEAAETLLFTAQALAAVLFSAQAEAPAEAEAKVLKLAV